jgi:hypothetical protein
MQLLVHHYGQQLGPFTVDEARSALAAGQIAPDDLAWYEGLTAWVPLSSLVTAPVVPKPIAPLRAPTSGLALTSVILGASSLFFCILTGIPAICFGHVARSEIRRSYGKLSGDGMAIAGLVLGYLSVAMTVLVGVFVMFFAGVLGVTVPKLVEEIAVTVPSEQATNAAEQVARACKQFATDHGGRFPDTLEDLVPDYVPERSMLSCPFDPDEEVGYFYYGGKDTDAAAEILMMSKSTDDQGRRVVVQKDGKTSLRMATPPQDAI